MKILVVSDTHGDVRNLAFVIRTLGERLDLIIHLGDGAADLERLSGEIPVSIPRFMVRGNMDSDPHLLPSRVASVRKHLIYASHGNAALASGSLLPLLYAAREAKASVCLFGHTHIPHRKRMENVLLLNPGSLSRPRGGWGPTFALLNVPEDGAGQIEAVHYEILSAGGRLSLHAVFP